jgi:putative DNA primase/helicase
MQFPDGTRRRLGDFSSNLSEAWQAKCERPTTTAEREAFHRQARKRADWPKVSAKRCRLKQRAKASAIWEAALLAPEDHPYLLAKGIKAHGPENCFRGDLVIREVSCDGALIVPLYDARRELRSLQFISSGGKEAISPQRPQSRLLLWHRQGPEGGEPLCVAEGYGTAASIHEASGLSDGSGFRRRKSARRCEGDAREIPRDTRDSLRRRRLPHGRKSGMTKATEAARAVGGLLAIPQFGENRLEGATDFNDLAQPAWQGSGTARLGERTQAG